MKPEQSNIPPKRSVAEIEQERQAKIKRSPKSRKPTPGDVEHFMDSYHHCGLASRWPGGNIKK